MLAVQKTKPSETPPVSIPSSGTGYRSASVEAPSRPAIPASVSASNGEAASETAVAVATRRPNSPTGRTTAASRGGMAAPELML